MATRFESSVVNGTLFWAFLAKHNPMKPGKYTVDLGNLSLDEVVKLKKIGLGHRIKTDAPKDGYKVNGDKFVHPEKPHKPNRGTYISLQSGFRPKVVDGSKSEINAEIVGNGSIADVNVTPYEWTFKGTTGVSGGFNAVVVRNIVAFQGGGTGNLDMFKFDSPLPEKASEDDKVDFEK